MEKSSTCVCLKLKINCTSLREEIQKIEPSTKKKLSSISVN